MERLPRYFNTALYLKGNAYVSLESSKYLEFLISFSLQAWIKISEKKGNMVVTSRFDGNTGDFLLGINDGYPIFYYRNTTQSIKSKKQLEVNKWHHLTVTYNSQNEELILYVDGIQEAKNQFSFQSFLGNIPILIGATGSTSNPSKFFNGKIGRIQIWSLARTLDEIIVDSLHVADPSNPYLQAYFDFTELPVVDQSGNNIKIQLSESAEYSLDIPLLNTKDIGYVDCGEGSTYDFSGKKPFSIEGWFCSQKNNGVIISKYDEHTGGEFQLKIEENRLKVDYNWDIYASELITNKIIEAGKFYHFAVIFCVDDKALKIYVNGNIQCIRYVIPKTSSDNLNLLIGANYKNNKPSNFFNGNIQNIRIWNKALTTYEIQQWMYNQPISEPFLNASFDFTVKNMNVDTTHKHPFVLKNGAQIIQNSMELTNNSKEVNLGFLEAFSSIYINQDKSTPIEPPDISKISYAINQSETSFDNYLSKTLEDMEKRMNKNNLSNKRKDYFRKEFDNTCKKIAEMAIENPKTFVSFSTIKENGKVQIIHHSKLGDNIIFEENEESVDDLTLWWIKFVYTLTIGFYQALGLVPSNFNIAKKVYNLVMRNQAVVQAMTTLIGKTITVNAAIAIIKVLYDENLIWPILKFAFTNAGWWGLGRIFVKVIAIATGVEAAEILAGFIIWAAQLTELAGEYPGLKLQLENNLLYA